MSKNPNSEFKTQNNFKVAKTFDDMLDQCQNISRADLRRLQNASLENILRHAWKTTPFYADRLAPLFGKDDTIDLSVWQDIPFLTRHELQNNFDALVSTGCPAAHGDIIDSKSSGSTGEPVRVLSTRFAALAGLVAIARGTKWFGIDYSLAQMQIIPPEENDIGYPGRWVNASWAPFWLEDNSSGAWYQLDHTTPHKQQLELLASHGRCYLNTMSGNVRELVFLAMKFPQLKPDLAGIQTLGELVSGELRQMVRDNLGCEIHDSYSTKELGCFATQCSINTNLHVVDELVLLEIIDEASGRPVAAGETGSVVVTSFYNYAMPLIRYKLGDLATRGPACACGRSLSVITEIVGRNRQLFRFPGGVSAMSGLSTADFLDFLKARKWQVAQTGETEIEIRFVSDLPEKEQNRAALVAAAEKRFPLKLTYVFTQLETIPNMPSGKFFEYICELPDNES